MKQFLRPTLIAATMAVALGMTAGANAQTKHSTARSASTSTASSGAVDKTKASYIIGYQVAGSIPPAIRESVDPAVVAKALQDALSGIKPNVTPQEAEAVMKPFMADVEAKAKAAFDQLAAKNKAEGDAFLAKNRTAPGVKVTASGLQYQVITQGTGARPGPSDTASINYVGTLIDGEVFDDSSKHPGGGPAAIPLGNVIPGFREGLQLMQVGGHYKFFIPANLAYGAQPGGQMPPNETLIFDVTLVKTGPTPAGGGSGQGASGG